MRLTPLHSHVQTTTQDEFVRVISPGGVPLGRMTMAQAHFYIREGLAKGVGGRKGKFRTLQMVHAQVESRVPGGMSLVYKEALGDHYHVTTLKRRAPDGSYVKWDPDLSFADLRAGRMRPVKLKKRAA